MKDYIGRTSVMIILSLFVCNIQIHTAAAICRDSPDYFYNRDQKKTCRWIQLNEKRRNKLCKYVEVHDNCPHTCGVCCENIPWHEIETSDGGKKNCEWIAQKKWRKETYCGVHINNRWAKENNRMVKDACQVACDFCYEPISGTNPTSSPPFNKKPNILLIMADDVGTGDIPLYWNSSLVDMPNIQRLANMGVTFKDAHSTPLCAPSRYVLLSGNYQHRGCKPNGVWGLEGEQNQFQPFQKSIAEALNEGGNYATAMYGKWHLGGKIPLTENGSVSLPNVISHKDHDWTQALIDGPQDIGFGSSLISTGGIQDPPYSYFRNGFLTTNVTDVKFWWKGTYSAPCGTSMIKQPGEGDPDWDSTAYNMMVVNETVSFIDTHMDSDRSEDPWFVYAALGAVHEPQSPPDFYLNGTPIAGTYKSRHMDVLYEMDKAVGSLVTMVEERGLAKDTIIIFTSDNGGVKTKTNKSSLFGHNSHGPLRGEKGEVYEGGHRVPLIFRYDGKFPVKETRNRIVGLNDIYRTLCTLAEVPVPETSAQDSVSFAKYIKSENNVRNLRKSISTWVYGSGKVASAIRFGSMKLVQHYGATAKTELYDLDNDLSEKFNLLHNGTFTNLIKRMKRMAKDIGPCPNDHTQFNLTSGPGKGELKQCNFFASKPARCEDGIYLDGETKCNSICGRHIKFCSRKFGKDY